MMSLNIQSKAPVTLSNRSFWIKWLLAFLGFPLAGLAAQTVVGGIDTPLQGLIGGVASGAVLGTVQWLALRGSLPISPRWILASAAGLGLGLALGVGVLGTETAGAALPLRGAVTGLLLGAAQAVVLRTVAPSLALRWLIAVPLGWALGWTVTRAAGVDLSPDFSTFGASGAVCFQVLTGLALRWRYRTTTSR
ncbi:hypothetical protein [Deinococcus sp.]|uniref:hypothetical protein n=1 Tax=Deinococcus sp. TaxID=47478 RepID=UPI003B5B6664